MTGVGSRHRPRRDWKPVAASVTRPRMSLVLQSFLPFPHGCQGPSPHQQGRDARMIEQCFGGIDVSQDRLDVLLLPQATRFSVANDEPGWNALIARLVVAVMRKMITMLNAMLRDSVPWQPQST